MKNNILFFIMIVFLSSCNNGKRADQQIKIAFSGAKGEVKIMTLDPGHFHAALVQKEMYNQVDPTVYVYAPDGPDVQDHLARIEAYNTREENPTAWIEKVYKGGWLKNRATLWLQPAIMLKKPNIS